MSEVTKPMALDETLQDVADALDNLTEGYAGESAYEAAVSGGYTMPQSQFEADTQAVRWRSNPNLLDNWYFIGGGDQQGAGIFPINQRKQTSYSGNTVACDRWWNATTNNILYLSAEGLKISISSSSNVNHMFYERIETPPNGIYTLSALITENTTTSGVRLRKDIQGAGSAGVTVGPVETGTGVIQWQIGLQNNGANVAFGIAAADRSADNGKYIVVAAMKLELGSEQTLAHLENGVWVLNEIPDYTTQLLRCQRFYRVFTSTSTSTTGYGYSTNPKNLRPEMRATPSTGSFTYGGTTYYYLNANL